MTIDVLMLKIVEETLVGGTVCVRLCEYVYLGKPVAYSFSWNAWDQSVLGFGIFQILEYLHILHHLSLDSVYLSVFCYYSKISEAGYFIKERGLCWIMVWEV